VAGGETFLSDAFAVAQRLRLADPQSFRSLLQHPVTFSKVHFDRDYPASLQYRRPVIVVNQGGGNEAGEEADILSVNWSPQFEAPLHIDPKHATLFYKAYRCDECVFRVTLGVFAILFPHLGRCVAQAYVAETPETPNFKSKPPNILNPGSCRSSCPRRRISSFA
jgi:hypothetical protein